MNNQLDSYIGTVFDERYKIVKKIGEGGMAVVYEAFDIKENAIVAVKVLKDEISQDSQSVKRFINESKAVSMMSHPNIVKIIDVSVKDNLKYIVMEYVEGVTLKSYMMQKGKLSVPEAISYTEQILRALDHAHTKGVTHRDIKPQNILLLKDGKIKVTDFGIAKLPNAETVTMTDKAIGTVYYISPEQASGKPIDSRSDIYSLGAMMYEMLTGRLPFNADSPVTVALMQVSAELTPPRKVNPDIPVGLEQIVCTAMQKKPEMRFQSARQMLSCLVQIKNNPAFVFDFKNPEEPKKPIEETAGAKKQEEKKKPVKRRYSMFPIILGITLSFLLVAGISAYKLVKPFLMPAAAEEETVTVTVPQLEGTIMTEEVRRGLNASGFRVIVEYDDTDDSEEANKVIKQSPAAGTEKNIVLGKQYTDVRVTLSRGQNSFMLSDYTVTDYRQVKIELEALGIKCVEENEYNDNIPLGYVIRTVPMPGETISKGDTVTLYVSKGEKVVYVQVPQLVGMTEKEAKKALEDAKITLGKVTSEYSNKEKGTVIKQSRKAYENVIARTVTIDIVLSKGPDPAKQTTSPDTASVPENPSHSNP